MLVVVLVVEVLDRLVVRVVEEAVVEEAVLEEESVVDVDFEVDLAKGRRGEGEKTTR